jgi:MYXO-CTERM domain-containing protein
MRRPQRLAAITLCTALFTASTAEAFCGFYVAGSDAALSNRATSVVLLRDGARTVLSMQNAYEGPPENFALVVPVPVVLQRENVRTLPREVFERVDRLAAPRLVEYWEQDPCDAHPPRPQAASNGSFGGLGHGGGLGVAVEAQFAVGEYDVVVLSATDSVGLETWLRRERYHLPASAAPTLAPYVRAGSKFFVARVDVSRVHFEDGHAMLSPLRVHYDSDTFSLPIRLGLLNSPGKQELIVHTLGLGQRFEAANRPNVFAPTNLDVRDGVRDHFGEFYNALFDRELARVPGAVVTEYAWQSTSCDPCPIAPLTEEELNTLGADVAPSLHAHDNERVPTILQFTNNAPFEGALERDTVDAIVERHAQDVVRCFSAEPATDARLMTRISVHLEVNEVARVRATPRHSGNSLVARVEACVAAAAVRWGFPEVHSAPAQIDLDWILMWRAGIDVPRPSRTSEWVLTRLHTRYGRDDVGEDLVFREAPPVAGGREDADDRGNVGRAAPSTHNNFQTRFSIRHPWTGPVACPTPERGVWGPPPPGVPWIPTRSAQNLAFASRGLSVDALLAPVTPPAPPPVAPTATPPARAPAPPAARSRGRFGCDVKVGSRSDGPWGLALLALGALRRRRR